MADGPPRPSDGVDRVAPVVPSDPVNTEATEAPGPSVPADEDASAAMPVTWVCSNCRTENGPAAVRCVSCGRGIAERIQPAEGPGDALSPKGCAFWVLVPTLIIIASIPAFNAVLGATYCNASTGEFRYPVGQAAVLAGITMGVMTLLFRVAGMRPAPAVGWAVLGAALSGLVAYFAVGFLCSIG